MIWCYCSIFNVALGHTRRSNRVHPVPQSSYVSPRQPPDVLVPTVDRAEISDGVFGDAESQETMSSEVVSEPSRYSQSRDCKAARTILLIAVAFLTCWVPYFIVAGLQVSGNTVDDVVVTTATLLAHCSSVLNIVIYGYLNKYLRIEMFRLLKQMRQNRSHDSTAVVNIESEENASTTFTTLSSLKLAYMPRGGTPRPKMKAKRDAPLNSDIHAIEELAEDSKSSTRCLQIRVQCSDSAENTAPGPLGTGLNSSHGDTDLAVSPKPKCCVTWQDKTKNDVKTKGGLILTPHFYMDEESTANDGSYFDDVIAGNSSPAVSTGDLC
ncbi:uncharacterized protein LOC106179734 [Lingula anatina]|uniref:Uncharacterized protein LOC106179734 n=1 Tax=Lingula anatina TaxID=7574 RepID=A0A1S3K8G0_LINAN|nr:uncharacterized protein LOC106179734 [Lingula anatina]|eukprot:XP_013418913.1 uncharacterized protein LOC106179734 [Lingula anatina]